MTGVSLGTTPVGIDRALQFLGRGKEGNGWELPWKWVDLPVPDEVDNAVAAVSKADREVVTVLSVANDHRTSLPQRMQRADLTLEL